MAYKPLRFQRWFSFSEVMRVYIHKNLKGTAVNLFYLVDKKSKNASVEIARNKPV